MKRTFSKLLLSPVFLNRVSNALKTTLSTEVKKCCCTAYVHRNARARALPIKQRVHYTFCPHFSHSTQGTSRNRKNGTNENNGEDL